MCYDKNGVDYMEKDKINSIKSIVFSILFLIWFFGSIIAMMILAEINQYYTVMIFGQYFLVFGIIPLTAKGNSGKWIALPFLLVGLACIIIPYLMMNPDLLKVEIIWDSLIPLLLIFTFVITGVSMIIFPILKKRKLEKLCTITLSATLVRHNYTYSDKGNKLYCPIYEFEFEKNKYEVSDNCYSNIVVKPIGTIEDIKINPDNPNEFLINNSLNKIVIIIGIIILLVTVPLLFYLLKTSSLVV